jgi:hypothetical protein
MKNTFSWPTGLLLTQAPFDGSQPFGVIENNPVENTIGYNLDINSQTARRGRQ